jgi:hypothetical protein
MAGDGQKISFSLELALMNLERMAGRVNKTRHERGHQTISQCHICAPSGKKRCRKSHMVRDRRPEAYP